MPRSCGVVDDVFLRWYVYSFYLLALPEVKSLYKSSKQTNKKKDVEREPTNTPTDLMAWAVQNMYTIPLVRVVCGGSSWRIDAFCNLH